MTQIRRQIDRIIIRLKKQAALQNVRFVREYGSEPVETPIYGMLAAVGIVKTARDTGFIGGLFVLLLYLSLLGRAAMIVRRSKRVLPSLLVIGMASFITFQALFHIAINVGLFPVSGQTLPLISKGGSSMLVICIAFGVMLSVSRTIANQGNKKNKADETPVIEGLDAENPTEIIPKPKNVWK